MDNFFEKVCQHKDCGRQFDNLHKLILHIESTHIDFSCMDDDKIKEYLESDDDEEFPTRGIPMSLVLPYSTEEQIAAFREEEELQAKYAEENGENGFGDNASEIIDVLATDDAGDGHARHPSSKAYWCGADARPENAPPKADAHRNPHAHPVTKKFACPVPGCTKSYKNVNGMKYHVVNYHDMHGNLLKPAKPKKEFKCTYCGKDYKTFRGLQSHVHGHQQQQQLLQQQPLQDPRGVPSALMQQHRGRPFYQKVDYYRQNAPRARHHHRPASASSEASSRPDVDDVVCFGEYALPASSADVAAARANLYGNVAAAESAPCGRQRLMMMHQGTSQGGYDGNNAYGFEDDHNDANAHYQQLHKQYFQQQQQQMFGAAAAGQRAARGAGFGGVGDYVVEPLARTTDNFEFVPVGHHRPDDADH